MQIIESTPEEKYNSVCDAGVELLKNLREILAKYDLTEDQACSVLTVASGGVLISGSVGPDEFLSAVSTSCKMWYTREGSDGLAGATFAPHTHPECFQVRKGTN